VSRLTGPGNGCDYDPYRLGRSHRWPLIEIDREGDALSQTAAPTATRPPLGLPNGSVRALLTLLVVAVVIVQVCRRREIEPLWTETLMIALAHYFTSRRFINLAPDVIRRLEAEGHVEVESNPLFLPRHSIRAIILLAFVGLAVYLYRANQLFEFPALSILGVVFAYLLGIVVRGLIGWWLKGRESRTIRGWEDAKATVVLVVLLYTAGAYLLDRPDLVPHQLRNLALGFVLFYFGSR
jgi:hypothetical protein